MDNELVMVVVAILVVLIALTVIVWVVRFVWMLAQSPAAFAILLGLLALTTSLIAISAGAPT